MNHEGRVLIVDDEVSMCELIATTLQMRGFETVSCHSASDAIGLIRKSEFDVVLTDVCMPGTTGLQLCQQIAALRPDVPVVVMTAFGSLETAVAAIRSGAYDFIVKPVEMRILAITIARAVEKRKLTGQIRLLESQSFASDGDSELLGDSEPMRRMHDQLARAAPSDASILITGESGTGKELVARSIHRHSGRSEKPFVAVNCAALSETLLESELFGHTRGAFTDARNERRGLFLEAEGGTLLLDEMGDMPLAMQVKLLRALEEKRLRPVGSDHEIEFDVRVLAATHRDLESAVEDGRFRQDLFYRINVIQLHLPPLRSRGADILRLAAHFIQLFAENSGKPVLGIAEPAAEKLLEYSWPGNVRELRNAMERAVALTQYDTVTIDDLPDKIRDFRSGSVFIGGDDPTELVSLEQIESRYIEHVLNAVNQNRTEAAKILGVDRKTLYRKLKTT
ncbi:Transcriptional regulatory protein ZraR [Planctomycetes bacterium CA13]|uniref:Transcriptional regulatory protein ZraR n=1 Tax=Novipirellula herctigrandis TaxID=2527986 RepID=A0A5C5Z2V3_9BACT|nr:Transcriptional regulatory protein ZraR [Planctomycetes bacterium CA13]